MKMDENLITLLYNNETTREHLFKKINNIYIFDKIQFGWIINNREFLPDSYTRFKNKIGLVKDNEYISEKNDITLAFPYKDCILEFDSTDTNTERKEIFFNENLMQTEINRLLYPKVFTKATKYTKEKAEKTQTISKNDNLIIKGNNLLVLYSLLPQYENMIKCMYWDILYNTNNDLVPYNDSFKHSSWLTMMKNRLEVAYKLLKEDGAIFIQCDYNEQAYLKVLMDEIFKNGYISMITVKTSSESGVKVNSNKPIKTSEYILIYAKNKEKYNYKQIRIKTGYDRNYSYYVENPEDKYENWKITTIRQKYSELNNKDVKKISEEDLRNFQIENCNNIFSVRDISDSLKKYIKENHIDKETVTEYITSTGKQTLLYKNGEVVFIKNKIFKLNGKYKNKKSIKLSKYR